MMNTKEKIQQFRELTETIQKGSDQARIEKQHKAGKLTARERLHILLDEGSFVEMDMFVKHRQTNFGMDKVDAPGDAVVTGYGTVAGRLVYVFAQDFTSIGGSVGEMHAKKICKILDMALKTGAPVIGINDSGGARIQEGIDSMTAYGQIFCRNTHASGVVPQISLIMGPCAGGASYSPALTDFIFMVEDTSYMFVAGPQVIKAVTGETVTNEEVGGASVHNSISGVAHFMSNNDEDCLLKAKELLSFLPSNNLEAPPCYKTDDDINRTDELLNQLIPDSPNKAYDMKTLIYSIADNGLFLEVQENYAKNIVIGFIRLNGKSVGVVANQPKFMAGCMDINCSDKASRFIRTCDAYNIPLLTIEDVPGFLPGVNQEFGGIIRHGAKMLFAYAEATVPKVTMIIRKAYGGSYLALCSRDMGADLVLAWPTAEIAVMGAEGASNIIFSKEIAKAENPTALREQKTNEYRENFSNPYNAAARGEVDLIIEPANSRPSLIKAFDILTEKRENGYPKKHGIFPV